jgi:hypothetical protein
MARSSSTATPDPDFADRWNHLSKPRRKQIRRLIRVCRQQQSPEDARLAVGYATYQRSRSWYRWFWAWYPLITLGALFAAGFVHPVVVGLVFGVAANALLVIRGYRRVETVNAELLGAEAAAAASPAGKGARKRTTKAKTRAAA